MQVDDVYKETINMSDLFHEHSDHWTGPRNPRICNETSRTNLLDFQVVLLGSELLLDELLDVPASLQKSSSILSPTAGFLAL